MAEEEEKKKSVLGITIPQIVGGALAAITTAFATAQLGVSGTIIGAGVGSLIAATAGAVYSASLSKGHETVKKAVLVHVPLSNDANITEEAVSNQDVLDTLDTLIINADTEPDTEKLAVFDTVRNEHVSLEVQAALADLAQDKTEQIDAVAETQALKLQEETSKHWWQGLNWKQIAMATILSLMVAFIGITGYERISGQSISGNDGTTLGGVVIRPYPVIVPTPTETETEPEPSPSPEQTSPAPTQEPSNPEPTTTAPEPSAPVTTPPVTPEPTPEPAPEPQPTQPVTPEPTEPVTPNPTPTPQPTPTPTPTTPAPTPTPTPGPSLEPVTPITPTPNPGGGTNESM